MIRKLCFAALLLLVPALAFAADAPAGTPAVITHDWAFWGAAALAALSGLRAMVVSAQDFFTWLAPRTKSTVDDTIRDDLKMAHDKLDALASLVGTIVPSAKPVSVTVTNVVPPTSTQGGFAARNLLFVLGMVGLLGIAVAASGCAASTRESTLKAAMVTLDASKEAYLAYDAHAQDEIVAHATSLDDGKAKLAVYRAKRSTVVKALTVGYQAEATAAQLNDDHSIAALAAALAEVVSTVKALTGGAL